MDGITVLSEEVVKGSYSETVYIVGIIFAIIVSFAFGGAVAELSDNNTVAISITGILTFIIVLFCTIYFKPLESKGSYVKYKVTIDDSVSFNEFNAKYKVLEQDGKIFTIVEREVEDKND
jgi:hypothetical protein